MNGPPMGHGEGWCSIEKWARISLVKPPMPVDETPGADNGVLQPDAAAVVADAYRRIAVAVRYWRHVRHLTQAALGARVGLSARTIRRIERRQTPVRLDTLTALAKGLDVPMERLVEPLK
jgi:DNA-binding XRE family transcriptional regulator